EMSVQVNLKALGVYKRSEPQREARSSENVINPFSFPKSRVSLWDATPNGDVVSLHLSYYRNPRLVLVEKALRLAYRQARQSNKPLFSCFLLGTLTVDDDEEGVTLTLDRFDPGREQQDSSTKMPTVLLPGDFIVPCTISTQGVASSDLVVHSADNFNIAFKMLQHSCCSRDAVDLSNLLILRAHLSCLEQLDSLSFNVRWVAITVANTLDIVPVRKVPIIPTALARNLSSPASMAQFLTMDQTRKLLLLIESDPKAYTLPLVGVWLSGITHIHSPQVWAWCLRYLYSSSLQDKVMSEDGAFLVILYSTTHREPEFYQCQPCSGQQEMAFQLLTSAESLNLYKVISLSLRLIEVLSLSFVKVFGFQCFDLFLTIYLGTRIEDTLDIASPQNKLSISDHDSGVEDDLSPRPSPSPHPLSLQTRKIHPSVPELSLVLDSSFLNDRKVTTHELSPPQCQTIPPVLQQRVCGPTHQICGPLPPRRPPTAVALPTKAASSRPKPGQQCQQLQPGTGRKSASPAGRRSSSGSVASPASSGLSSSSSSSSTPNSGCSPNVSTHFPREPAAPLAASPRGLSPIIPYLPHSSQAMPPTLGHQGLRHSSSLQSLTPVHPLYPTNFHSTPSPNHSPDCVGSACNCCPYQRSHAPVCRSSTWKGVANSPLLPHVPSGSSGTACCTPSENSSCCDCCTSPSRRAFACQSSPHHSPTCVTNNTVQRSPPHNICSMAVDPGTHSGLPVEQGAITCQAPCCQKFSSYPSHPESCLTTTSGSGSILPADTYKILIDQNRQLKVLQAQLVSQNTIFSCLGKLGGSCCLYCSVKCRGCNSIWRPVVFNFPLQGQVNSHFQHPQREEEDMAPEQAAHIMSCSERQCLSPGGLEAHKSPHKSALIQLKGQKKALRYDQTDDDQVLKASLKHLQQLGAKLEVGSTPEYFTKLLFSSSTLACINPETLVPKLAFSESLGASISGPSDSLDLATINLKYLSDLHLSQLLVEGIAKGPLKGSGMVPLGSDSTETRAPELSIFSSSDMSFATRKFLKRFGHMGSGSREEKQQTEVHKDHQRRAVQQDSALGCSAQTDISVDLSMECDGKGGAQKNINHKAFCGPPCQNVSPLHSQNQLLQDLRPKMQLLAKSTNKKSQKENIVPGGVRGQQLVQITQPEGSSMGNFLDLSRLRQLPKLF
uniref:STIL centriolar assembly protein n=1 Tax=Scleropages formosus TaxID=113540 RepID=A0A8C9S7Z5_SCLFO